MRAMSYDPQLDTPDDAPLDETIPDQPPGSPARHDEDPANVPWWTPSWQDAAKHLGWRWILPPHTAVAIILLGL